MTKPLDHSVALIEFALPVCMLLIAATRAGSILHVNPAADASSKMLRVTWKVTKHYRKCRLYRQFLQQQSCIMLT